jgi:Protein of unknown function (DUF1822)
MTNYITNDLLEFEGLIETISLDAEHCNQALELSDRAANPDRKWQIYLQALALFSFEDWLQERESTIFVNREQASVLQPNYANAIDAVCNLSVGEFKVCLIPTVSFSEEEAIVPRAVIDLPEFIAHFYIVIGIEDELEIAAIRGFLRYDELANYQPELQPEADWNYQLPLSWFNREPDELLLFLQCLDATAIALPEIPSNRHNMLAQMQAALLTLLPQLRHRPLWQVLTWEQGVAVLTTPDLLNWIYQSLNENTTVLTNYLSDLLQLLTQEAVNVRRWLGNSIDEGVQELFWEVLPAGALVRIKDRTPAQELEEILTEIHRNNEVEIPAIAGRTYRDITREIPLRMYAVVWPLSDEENGWTLLLILKAMAGNQPTLGFTLRVSDQTGILDRGELQPHSDRDYIFIQVAGSYDDKFLATITSETGAVQTLPPFEFFR